MRIMACVMAANVSTQVLAQPWPVHVYKSLGCAGTTVAYTIASLSLHSLLSDQFLKRLIPQEAVAPLQASWQKFTADRVALSSIPEPENVTQEQILAWSKLSVDIHRDFLNTFLPSLKAFVVAPLLAPIVSIVSNGLVWPLRKVSAWMAIQSAADVAQLPQNPLRIFNEIVRKEGIRGLYAGFHLCALQSLIQLGFNAVAGGVAVYGLNYLHNQLNKFMNYQQRESKIYNPKVRNAKEATEALYYGAFATIKFATPLLCIFSALGLMFCGRFASMPISLMTAVRLVQDSPSLTPDQSFVSNYAPRMSDYELLQDLLFSPMRAQLWSWIGWHWKWFMLSAVASPLGLYITADLELK